MKRSMKRLASLVAAFVCAGVVAALFFIGCCTPESAMFTAVVAVKGEHLVYAPAPRVMYVPGWLKCHAPRSETIASLKDAYPECESAPLYYDWDGNGTWSASLAEADKEAVRFAEYLAEWPSAARSDLTVVGHSLGARIVIKAAAILASRGLQVGEIVALAAAMPADDPSLGDAAKASMRPMTVMCNPNDFTLKRLYGIMGGESAKALGLAGPPGPVENCRIVVVDGDIAGKTDVKAGWGNFDTFKRIALHHALFYIEQLKIERSQ